ncbi:MAG: N-acetylglucosamine-6-phosphate deacetylase [Actinomycetota bacterium]
MTPSLLIAGGRVLVERHWVDADVEVAGGTISAVEPRSAEGPASTTEPLDATGLLVAPGLIDVQINGAFGHDFTRNPESVWDVGAMLPRSGVTAFLPTIVSSPPDAAKRALEVLAAGPPEGYVGATSLGLHFEGPMLAPSRRGAHDERYLQTPSADVIAGWSHDAGVRLVTLAPELPRAGEVIRELVANGVVVSAGHSDASFEQAVEAFAIGVTSGTHLFNAMSGFHHREPGLSGALLMETAPPSGLIVDGAHVYPGAVAAAWAARGANGLMLVTDAVAATGVQGGTTGLSLGGHSLSTDGSVIRDDAGRLAGSALTLDLAVRNLVAFTGAEPAGALVAASSTPARVIGEPDRGDIRVGAAADLVILDDALEVLATIVGGRIAFDRRGTPIASS